MSRSPLWHVRSAVAQMRRRVRDRWRGETADTFFDIHDPRELNPLLTRLGHDPLAFDPAAAETGADGAARFVLALLARSPKLRRRFPHALSDGSGGPFFAWLAGEGARSYRLSPKAVENVRAAFAADLSQRVRRVFELRSDLRKAFPFALTPKQRGLFAEWLLVYGRSDFGLRIEEVLWYLFETDEEPTCGLAATFLLMPHWQERFPHGLTRFGWDDLVAWLKSEYQLAGRWFENVGRPSRYGPWDELRLLRQARPELDATFPHAAERAGQAGPVREWLHQQKAIPLPDGEWFARLEREAAEGLPAARGVNVVAHYRYASGLQEAAFAVVRGLHLHGVRTPRRDLPVNFPADWRDRERYQDVELFDVSIVAAAANTFLDHHMPLAGLRMRPGVHRIAIWYWELEQVPAEWAERAKQIDEIWAPTRFIADAMRKSMPKPVVPMLPGVELPPVTPLPKAHFGLDPEKFLFLFMFDMGSVMARKNPLGLIDAFRRAFRRDDPVQLAIKVSRGEFHPESRRELLEAGRANGVTIIDRVMPREEALGLLATSDAYISLHRSEGLGLSMAEAMLLGKPTIATGYSGNVDFMTPQNSLLVDCRRVPIVDDIPPYPKGCIWADPDLDHAARLMREVVAHPREAAAIGAKAKRELEALLSLEAAGRRMVERLEQIGWGEPREKRRAA